jgi:hypothetical protein
MLTVLMLSLVTFEVYAQEKGLDVDISIKKENEWYQQPWVWVVGGAVFILLLAAILRGNSKRE